MFICIHIFKIWPLFFPARNYSNVAMILLHAGADFDLANAQGYTPIHLAAREGLLGLWFHEFLLLVFFIILMNYKFWFHVFFCFVFRSCSKPLCLWMCCWHIDLWWKLSPSFSGQKWLVILLVSRIFFRYFWTFLWKISIVWNILISRVFFRSHWSCALFVSSWM